MHVLSINECARISGGYKGDRDIIEITTTPCPSAINTQFLLAGAGVVLGVAGAIAGGYGASQYFAAEGSKATAYMIGGGLSGAIAGAIGVPFVVYNVGHALSGVYTRLGIQA